MVVQGRVHEKIVPKGSRDIVEEKESTTTRPADAAVRGGAHGGSVPIELRGHKELNGVTTLQGGGVAAAATATKSGNKGLYRGNHVWHPYMAESPIYGLLSLFLFFNQNIALTE